MSESTDRPTIELAPDDYFEENEPRQQIPEEELEEVYLRQLFETYGEATLREVLGDEYEEKRQQYESIAGSGTEKRDEAAEIVDYFDEAHEKAVQWKADEYAPDLSKAPGIWRHDDEVPDAVLDELREQINHGDVLWEGGYDKLPPGAEATVQGVLEERMTQPQGWSLRSLVDHLRDALGDVEIEDGYLINVLRDETSAVLNAATADVYEESEEPDEEFEYRWIGPSDHRTTDTCETIEDRIEDRGGSVPMDVLKQILYEEAVNHSDAEGTPSRADDFLPHHNCRRRLVRRVKSI